MICRAFVVCIHVDVDMAMLVEKLLEIVCWSLYIDDYVLIIEYRSLYAGYCPLMIIACTCRSLYAGHCSDARNS